jgi:hypothetical protein
VKKILILTLALAATAAFATIFGKVQGVVHDPQHRPVTHARITLRSATSDFSVTTESNGEGEFLFQNVPVGDYIVTADAKSAGFALMSQQITVHSASEPVLHMELAIATTSQTTTVTSEPPAVNVDSVTPTTLVDRFEIARTPGADRTNSLQMITDFVPGAYETHDMLHIRGGHQVTWLIDGVAIPNTEIAVNLGPQIDPKDVDYLEVLRGSYESDLGDRTYGMFNVVPRTGFERNNEGEVVLSAGNFYQTNDQINIGSHTSNFAYFASVNGNRSNYGLQTPIADVYHDAENGFGGFGSIIYNKTSADQFRVVAQSRRDFYQIPYDPDPNSYENQLYPSYGLRDGQTEADTFVATTWLHTFSDAFTTQVSPFYHFNSANYSGKPNDFPVDTTSNRTNNYGGLQSSANFSWKNNNISAGIYGFGQHEAVLEGATSNDPSNPFPPFLAPATATGGIVEEFVQDNYRATSWLTFIGGLRYSTYRSTINENYLAPRIGVAVEIPKLHWVFRAFYGRYYQPPPLIAISGALLGFAGGDDFSFVPLHGEQDEEHQFGVQIPLHGWVFDADTFKTRAINYLDHENIGESSIYIPVTFAEALINGWELTIRTPREWKFGSGHLAYSNQIAKARGPITGGFICEPVTAPQCNIGTNYYPVDHDQRNTLNIGFDANLPKKYFASTNVYYGSGFTNGYPSPQYPGAYLPQHTTFDLSGGRDFGKWSASLTVLNVTNTRVLLDNSLTFGGFHYNDPREIYAEVRWKFKY